VRGKATWAEMDSWTRQRILDANDMLDALDEADYDERREAERKSKKRDR
jgi:hypothetical protein